MDWGDMRGMGVNTKELLLWMICTGWECVGAVRRFEGDEGRFGEGCDFEEGNTGGKVRREYALCAAKYTQ